MHGGMEPFDLAIGGRLVCGGSGLVNFKEFAQLLKELAFEVGAPIGQDLEGAAVRANDLVE